MVKLQASDYKNMAQKLSSSLVYGVIVLAILAFVYLIGTSQKIDKVEASTIMGNDYQATTTFAASVPLIRQIKSTAGSLNSVNITGKNTGLLTFYNATTSDITKRTGQVATSSILIADFPTNAPEGTYTFDAEFSNGLLMIGSGAIATSTVTYR